eukprot:CAMPEP_0201732566 /NCGR_PEP_ID=MMETSP0593-20130828/29148_1 /ASSEMBLY_ACC=CAM_ASM_000672 /TAXON_ID=267983 /ORGANISM="Skeletonema japonicum, Strain CCMP2506" /LENGTH=96 /DNA_ID=CAMNT_0048225547 /DNA_START=35 /DNA_END=322 /DNA_ORIENTATION=-
MPDDISDSSSISGKLKTDDLVGEKNWDQRLREQVEMETGGDNTLDTVGNADDTFQEIDFIDLDDARILVLADDGGYFASQVERHSEFDGYSIHNID